MRTTLDQLAAGQNATIATMNLEPESAERLMEMGLLEGTPVQLLKFAPLGDPLEIVVRGYHLTLRKHEAQQITVEIDALSDASTA